MQSITCQSVKCDLRIIRLMFDEILDLIKLCAAVDMEGIS